MLYGWDTDGEALANLRTMHGKAAAAPTGDAAAKAVYRSAFRRLSQVLPPPNVSADGTTVVKPEPSPSSRAAMRRLSAVMAAPDAAGLMAPPNAVQTRIRRSFDAGGEAPAAAPAAAEAPAEAPVEAAEAPPPKRAAILAEPTPPRRAGRAGGPEPAPSPPPPKRRGYSVKAWENRDDLELEA